MLDEATTKLIQNWTTTEDVGAFNQWLDSMQKLKPIFAEHGLTIAEGYSVYLQIHHLYKICAVRDLLQQIIDNDISNGDTPT